MTEPIWMCPICNEYKEFKNYPMIINTCGHSVCQECSIKIKNNKCPHCMKDIINFIPDYAIGQSLGLEYKQIKNRQMNKPLDKPLNNPINIPMPAVGHTVNRKCMRHTILWILIVCSLVGIFLVSFLGIKPYSVISDNCSVDCHTFISSCDTNYNNDTVKTTCIVMANIVMTVMNDNNIYTTWNESDGSTLNITYLATNTSYFINFTNNVCQDFTIPYSCYYLEFDPNGTLTDNSSTANSDYNIAGFVIILVFCIIIFLMLCIILFFLYCC